VKTLTAKIIPHLRVSPGRWHKITFHDKLSKRRAKNAANCASACSPTDFVSDAGLVRVPQDSRSEKELSA